MRKPTIIRQYGGTDFITTLRAIAATMVVISHTSGFANFGWVGENITETGKYGVQMFFVISGYTITKTFLDAPNYSHYLTRRLFRIAPMYYVSILVASALILSGYMQPVVLLTGFQETIDVYNLALHFTFLSFFDYSIANSIIGVEWSLPIEIFWYVLLPILILRITSVKNFGRIFLGAIIISLLTYMAAIAISGPYYVFVVWFMPPMYGVYFLGAVASYCIRNKNLLGQTVFAKYAPITAVLIFLAAILVSPTLLIELGVLKYSIGFALCLFLSFFSPASSFVLNRILTIKPFLFIGSISYSIYLIHNIVIQLLKTYAPDMFEEGLSKLAVVFLVTILLSTITYYTIEKTTNAYGRRVADKYFGNVYNNQG